MNHEIPSAEFQLAFLHKLQRLLDEGNFVSTYKFALLIALADLSVEKGNADSGGLTISSLEIAEKFIALYWPSSKRYISQAGDCGVIQQNTGMTAAVVSQLIPLHKVYRGSLVRLRRDNSSYQLLIKSVASTVRQMPLWKLQTFPDGVDDFLYINVMSGGAIDLRSGVAYCFRMLHSQIIAMVQSAWLRWIRRLKKNQNLLGQSLDLQEFLFGSDRKSLSIYQPLLQEIQSGGCFYCNRAIRGGGEIDHFVPWARYPTDLGHNFVLSHGSCNNDKRDLLASERHLEK